MSIKRQPPTQDDLDDSGRLREVWREYKNNVPGATQEWLASAVWDKPRTQGAVNAYLKGRVKWNIPALAGFSRVLCVPPERISPRLAPYLKTVAAGMDQEPSPKRGGEPDVKSPQNAKAITQTDRDLPIRIDQISRRIPSDVSRESYPKSDQTDTTFVENEAFAALTDVERETVLADLSILAPLERARWITEIHEVAEKKRAVLLRRAAAQGKGLRVVAERGPAASTQPPNLISGTSGEKLDDIASTNSRQEDQGHGGNP